MDRALNFEQQAAGEGKIISLENVRLQFAKLGVDITKQPEIYERLVLLDGREDSHFYDATVMANMISQLWPRLQEKLNLPDDAKLELLLATLVHDVGKSGPAGEAAEAPVRKIFRRIFSQKEKLCGPETTVDEFMALINMTPAERAEARVVLKDQLDADVDTLRVREFWRDHVGAGQEILAKNLSADINKRVLRLAALHHVQEGEYPADLDLDNIPLLAMILEEIDKYQAGRDRGKKPHQVTIDRMIERVSAAETLKLAANPDAAKKKYLEIIQLIKTNGEPAYDLATEEAKKDLSPAAV